MQSSSSIENKSVAINSSQVYNSCPPCNSLQSNSINNIFINSYGLIIIIILSFLLFLFIILFIVK